MIGGGFSPVDDGSATQVRGPTLRAARTRRAWVEEVKDTSPGPATGQVPATRSCPSLTKLGCNQGACHSAQHGKGGFKLSLLGFEPEPDRYGDRQERRGATGHAVRPRGEPDFAQAHPGGGDHGGGKRMEANSPESRPD